MNKRSYPRNYPRFSLVQSLNLNEEQTSTSRYSKVGLSFNTVLRLHIGKMDSRAQFSREKAGIFEGRVGVRANSRAVQSCVPRI